MSPVRSVACKAVQRSSLLQAKNQYRGNFTPRQISLADAFCLREKTIPVEKPDLLSDFGLVMSWDGSHKFAVNLPGMSESHRDGRINRARRLRGEMVEKIEFDLR